jgi:AcrR family transcriptional regulator
MARPKSPDKHSAIIAAAIQVFAANGLSATPTSAISKAAGVAEGTLFTYFSTKSELINALYCTLKIELAELLMGGFPRQREVRAKLQHLWDRYVDWGVANPDKLKVMLLLRTSDALTDAARAAGYAPFAEVEQMALESIQAGVLRDYPVPFIAAMMSTLAETTISFIALQPSAAARYRSDGFAVLWHGLARMPQHSPLHPPHHPDAPTS